MLIWLKNAHLQKASSHYACTLYKVFIMFAELIGGILSNSLALISDAGHMFTDALALSIPYSH